MPRKIIFFIKSLLLSLVIIGNIFAAEISIIPLKKPILNEEVQNAKISQGILKPKSKPSKKIEETKTHMERIKNIMESIFSKFFKKTDKILEICSGPGVASHDIFKDLIHQTNMF